MRWLFGQAKGLLGSRQRQQQQQQQQGSASVALITMCESGMGLLNLR